MRDTVGVRVDREVWRRIKVLSATEERTVQAVVNRLLRERLALISSEPVENEAHAHSTTRPEG